MLVNCIAYQDGVRLANIGKDKINDFLKKPKCIVWVALKDPTKDELIEMQQHFNLPELAIEDAQHGHQRPKIEDYNDSVFAILHIPDLHGDELVNGEFCVFVGRNYVLSVRKNSLQGMWHIRDRLQNEPNLLKIGSGIIFYALIDGVVDLYLPVIYALASELDQLEESIFNEQASRDLVRKLYNLKSKVMQLKHATEPLLSDLTRFQGERKSIIFAGVQNYFRDVSDHLNRISTSIESILETINMAMQANISLIAIEDSQINKRLAAWAGIFAAATALVGVWGMNFKFMPELKWKFGYPLALIVIAITCGYLYRKFKKSGWL